MAAAEAGENNFGIIGSADNGILDSLNYGLVDPRQAGFPIMDQPNALTQHIRARCEAAASDQFIKGGFRVGAEGGAVVHDQKHTSDGCRHQPESVPCTLKQRLSWRSLREHRLVYRVNEGGEEEARWR